MTGMWLVDVFLASMSMWAIVDTIWNLRNWSNEQ